MTDSAEPSLLEATGISRRFGAVKALDDVTVRVVAGEIVALAGENGSGKSTLARIFAGALPADAGEIVFDGVARTFEGPRDALVAGIAIVTQELTAVHSMSVAENVLLTDLHRPASVIRRRDLARRAGPFLRQVGLDVDPMTTFGELPPGMRELAEVAKALAARPKLLILDEATTRLPDPEALFLLVERLAAEEGLATIFITQRLREIRRLAHRAVVLRDGRAVGELTASELSDERLSELMVGREISGYFHKRAVDPGEVVLEVQDIVTDRSPARVSLSLRSSEIVGLAGLVGSGRTELLETIGGGRRPRAGQVRVNSTTIRPGSTGAAIRSGLTLLPEDRLTQGLLRDASVSTNLALANWRTFGLATRGRDRAGGQSAVDRLRIRCGSVDADIATLSGGNQQKVVFARCMSSDPIVLLLDEPTRGVDVGAREEIYAIIAELVARGVAIIVASSDMPELIGLCDRILVLNEGHLAGELTRAEATEERILLLGAGELEAADAA